MYPARDVGRRADGSADCHLTAPPSFYSVWSFYLVSGYVSLFLVLMAIAAIVTMREITKKDDQRLRQVMMRARMRLPHLASRAHVGRNFVWAVKIQKTTGELRSITGRTADRPRQCAPYPAGHTR